MNRASEEHELFRVLLTGEGGRPVPVRWTAPRTGVLRAYAIPQAALYQPEPYPRAVAGEPCEVLIRETGVHCGEALVVVVLYPVSDGPLFDGAEP